MSSLIESVIKSVMCESSIIDRECHMSQEREGITECHESSVIDRDSVICHRREKASQNVS